MNQPTDYEVQEALYRNEEEGCIVCGAQWIHEEEMVVLDHHPGCNYISEDRNA